MNRRFILKSAAAFGTLGLVSACAETTTPDIVEIAASNPDFSTLVAALDAAGLVATLKGPGPFTVFAPTNAAFDALAPGTLDSLLLPENRARLTDVLTYHVVPGLITSDRLIGQKLRVASLQGQNLRIDATSKLATVRVNDARVTQADIIGANGVIHVIDKVLIPAA